MNVRFSGGWDIAPKDGLAYQTAAGKAYQGTAENFLDGSNGQKLKGKVNLVLTSPPFPLLSPKRYGNSQGDDYIDWLVDVFGRLRDVVAEDGSIVVEIGNAWNKGEPTMSLVPLQALIAIKERLGLYCCQHFICNNTARLPGPAVWVTKRRIRVKDSFTHVWWLAPTPHPKADNRKVLQPYSPAMRRLIDSKRYNAGRRPSDHVINSDSFLNDNGGSIPPSVLNLGNTANVRGYTKWCSDNGVQPHPARMQQALVEFFVQFLTDPGDLVYDPFGGSNTTGSVAEMMGRRWVISEPSADYLMGSVGRFR